MPDDIPAAIANLPPLREVLKQHGIAPDKRLGQNFLFDSNLTDRIARAAGDITNCTVIEIGPGPGGLTRSILKAGAKQLIAIERDSRCLGALKELEEAVKGRFTIIEADALEVQETEIASSPIKIIANLPYNISTVLLFKWLERVEHFASFTLMFQKEVAERITAKPRTKDYGRLSVMAQWLCETKQQFDISPKAFIPPPKVTSTVVNLIPRQEPLFPAERKDLEHVLKLVFNQRRKILRSSLKQVTPTPELLLEKAGLSPMARPEELSVEQFCALARAYRELK